LGSHTYTLAGRADNNDDGSIMGAVHAGFLAIALEATLKPKMAPFFCSVIRHSPARPEALFQLSFQSLALQTRIDRRFPG
jgi:hypothetical protein